MADMKQRHLPLAITLFRIKPNRWDIIAAVLFVGLLAALAVGSHEAFQPLAAITARPLSLDPFCLPFYALRTMLRMALALALSLLFTMTYATLAAKSKRAEMLLIPLLDILQSVPILGFLSVTVVFFLSLTPAHAFGAECAAIFVIFTSQAWNMTFSFYQSLRTVPEELIEASRNFHFSPWMRFWRLEFPFAMPQLVWNMVVSVAGGWFFVVASESISVGDIRFALPGIGSYIALAIQKKDFLAIGWAIAAMIVVLMITDQLFFRPLLVWSERFLPERDPNRPQPRSWVLTMLRRSWLAAIMGQALQRIWQAADRFLTAEPQTTIKKVSSSRKIFLDRIWVLFLFFLTGMALWSISSFVIRHLSFQEIKIVLTLGLFTMLRVFAMLALASAIWVPIGVFVGMRPKLATNIQPFVQFLSAFPANLLFPMVVSAIVAFKLNPEIWLTPLLILGAQWYILFNVIAGASAIPLELKDASRNLRLHGWLWWRTLSLPAIFPFYITGAITAAGGAWNASIVAEVVSWGNTSLAAHGLGAYIVKASHAGDFNHLILGIATMSFFVVLINRTLWRPLFAYASRRFQLS